MVSFSDMLVPHDRWMDDALSIACYDYEYHYDALGRGREGGMMLTLQHFDVFACCRDRLPRSRVLSLLCKVGRRAFDFSSLAWLLRRCLLCSYQQVT